MARGAKPFGVFDVTAEENVSMEVDRSVADNSLSHSSTSSVSGNSISSPEVNAAQACERNSDADESFFGDNENILFDEESNDLSSENSETNNEGGYNQIDNEDNLRVKRVVNDVPLYLDSEATVNETVLDLVRMYVDRGCTKSLLTYTLNMMLKTMPKNHNFPTSIYKLFQFVKNLAPKFTSIEHFY